MLQETQQAKVSLDFDGVLDKGSDKGRVAGRLKKLSHRMLQSKYLMLQARHWKRNALFLLHSFTFDRRFEKLLFVPSKGAVREIQLHFDPVDAEEDVNPKQVPVKSVKWALDILPREEAGGAFVDGGAGRGQSLLIAAARPFDKIIGVEHSETLRDDANMNIAQFPRSYMRCRQVACSDAEPKDIPVPDGRAVFMFQKPRHMGDFQAQLDKIAADYKENPRRLYILTLGAAPQVNDMILHSGVFERASYSNIARLKHRLLSPYRIKAYKTLV